MVSDGMHRLNNTFKPRAPATDVYGLAATLYTLLTAKCQLQRVYDQSPHASSRDLQPQLSVVNQAVMWGMAVEARFRPSAIAEWLSLLPTLNQHIVIASAPAATMVNSSAS